MQAVPLLSSASYHIIHHVITVGTVVSVSIISSSSAFGIGAITIVNVVISSSSSSSSSVLVLLAAGALMNLLCTHVSVKGSQTLGW